MVTIVEDCTCCAICGICLSSFVVCYSCEVDHSKLACGTADAYKQKHGKAHIHTFVLVGRIDALRSGDIASQGTPAKEDGS